MSALPPFDYVSLQPAIPPNRTGWWVTGWIIFVLAVLAVLVIGFAIALTPRDPAGAGSMDMALSDFYQQLKAGNVASLEIDLDEIDGTFRRSVMLNGTAVLRFRTYLPQGMSQNWVFTQMVLDAPSPPTVRATPSNGLATNVLLPLIPWLLILGFVWFFVVRPLRKNSSRRTPMPVIIMNPVGQDRNKQVLTGHPPFRV